MGMRTCHTSKQSLPSRWDIVKVVWLLGPISDEWSYPRETGVGAWAAHKAGHSPLFRNLIFGTREGKTYHQGRKSVKFGANESKWWNSKEPKIQNSIRRFQFETSMRG
ncbi:hypothetical protein AVEN_106030-1 [Araneus ventricosus]|uniref:Uncharacterized protein n=1 Tax=Araneus ventricosus TaxID=182803 RepID=A0A4Y2X6I7_ARAVE|nr:hypothetical protein AVEN_228957-1 [Araneus ventricosus]GBO44526.1 hypothetical protein AVEN_106030-1 [Araneus ventricosus]